MFNQARTFTAVLGLVLLCLQLQSCDPNESIIITDDILMLTVPAPGLELEACDDFASSRSFDLPAANNRTVQWSEAKSLVNDTLKIIRLDIVSDTGSVAQFTMTLRPLSGKPSEIQCMKGFGCTGVWESFPWVVPGQNLLDQTVLKFKVVPKGVDAFTIENYNTNKTFMVRVNPPI